MRVFLYVCTRYPHQVRSGLDLRVLGHLRALSKIGKVVVFALQGDPERSPNFVDLFVSSDNSILSALTNSDLLRAMSVEKKRPFAHRASQKSLTDFLQLVRLSRPDCIIFSRLETTEYFFSLKDAEKTRCILDLDESVGTFRESMTSVQDIGFPLINHYLLSRELEYEKTMIKAFPIVWLSSRREINHLQTTSSDFSDTTFRYVPNAVVVPESKFGGSFNERFRLCYTGNFNYLPNQHGLRFLLDHVMPILPSSSLTVLGSGLDAWDSQGNIYFVKNPDSMFAHLQTFGISLVPIFLGAGTRLKALESMAAGLPLVSTSKGVEGLELEPYRDYLPAERPCDFVERIGELQSDSRLFEELSVNGVKKVEREYSVSSLVKIFRSMPYVGL